MVDKRLLNNEFDKVFNGTVIVDRIIEDKLHVKHKVYCDDLADALGDPYKVVLMTKQRSTTPTNKPQSNGILYEILAETESCRILFIVGRLFQDGNLYIITSYWADKDLESFYYKECEVFRDE